MLAETALVLVSVLLAHAPVYVFVAPVLGTLLQLWTTLRSRIRLTTDGIEVRRFRTRTYAWSDIESVQRAPEWENSSSIWLHLRGRLPQSEPEVLVPPARRSWRAAGRTLDDIVALMQERVAQHRAVEGPREPS